MVQGASIRVWVLTLQGLGGRVRSSW